MQGPYVIQISKLHEGLNRLEFSVDSSFFAELDYAKIREIEGKVVVEIERGEHTHKIWLEIQAKVRLNCDRCSENIFIPISNKHKLVIKQTDEIVAYDDEDIISMTKHQNEFDLAPAIYDFINISIPLKVSCDIEGAEKKCDQELLERLQNAAPNIESGTIDPRWEQLNKIRNKQ